ncbi:hypothetical protein MNBD_GAMMA18-62 [hydrothermal vent metagenome]|uniref:Uncharacterized protein n=1 Tax=hydrothermal vent metagenome TaxID=652676 RepID=A0A3B0ZGN3_9ZZZZ
MSIDTRAKFMMGVATIFFIYSLLWGLAPFAEINISARIILDLADWPVDNFSTPLDRNTMWLSAIGAGLLAAIAIFLGGIVVPAIREGNSSIIRTTIVAMSIWYIIDGIGSIAAGVASNLFFNSIYLALVLIPLVGIDKTKTS